MSRAVMQQALEALEWAWGGEPLTGKEMVAIAALRAALAEPDSDYERGFVDGMNLQTKGSVDKAVNRIAEPRPIQECYGDCPTNPKTCPNPCNFEGRPKPEQEPVAWMVYAEGGASAYVTDSPNDLIGAYRALPLYTAPTPRKPLTDEQIVTMYAENPSSDAEMIEFARAIERAHGIGGGE